MTNSYKQAMFLQEGDEFTYRGQSHIVETVTGVHVNDELRAHVLTVEGLNLYIKEGAYVEVTA